MKSVVITILSAIIINTWGFNPINPFLFWFGAFIYFVGGFIIMIVGFRSIQIGNYRTALIAFIVGIPLVSVGIYLFTHNYY